MNTEENIQCSELQLVIGKYFRVSAVLIGLQL
jgi:hypothetical protein